MTCLVRSVTLAAAVVLAYLFLQGWPPAWHPVLRVCLAVSALVLALTWWGWCEPGKGVKTRPHRPPRWLDYATIGALALLAESLFLLFFATIPEKAEAAAVGFGEFLHPERVQNPRGVAGADGSGENSAGNSLVSGNWLWNEAGRRPLQTRMKARPSNRPEVYLYPEDEITGRKLVTARTYLRSFSLAKYQDAAWSPKAFETRSLRAEKDLIDFPATERESPTYNYEVYHEQRPPGRNFLIGIPGLRSAKLSFLREFLPQSYRLPPLPEGEKFYRYTLSSAPKNFDHLLTVDNARTLDLRPVQDADPVYLDLPDEPAVRDAVLQAAANTRGNTVFTLHQIRKNLRARCTYSLDIRNPEGFDPLENFLLHEKRGHCELFATAAALICRASDIPARVAYGWSGGHYFPEQNFFVFRGKEAHAWTEILLEGYGWVIFDTTPTGTEEASPTVAPPGELPPENPFQSRSGAETPDGGTVVTDMASMARFLKWVAGISLLAFLLFIALRRRGDDEESDFPAAARLPDFPGYLKNFRRACQARGFPMPLGRTLRQQLTYLESEDCAPDFSDELLRYHYATTYASGKKQAARERKFRQSLKQWARA